MNFLWCLALQTKNLMTTRVSMLLKSHASSNMLPFSLCNKKRLAIRHTNRPLFQMTLLIPSYKRQEVVRTKDLSAPRHICSFIYWYYQNKIIKCQMVGLLRNHEYESILIKGVVAKWVNIPEFGLKLWLPNDNLYQHLDWSCCCHTTIYTTICLQTLSKNKKIPHQTSNVHTNIWNTDILGNCLS